MMDRLRDRRRSLALAGQALDAARDALQKEQAALLADLDDILSKVPDIPGIRRLSGNCFAIRASSLTKGWSPMTYDIPAQGKAISRWLAGRSTLNLIPDLKRLIKEKRVDDPTFGTVHLADSMVGYLEKVVGEL